MTPALDLFDRIEQLRYPTDLVAAPDDRLLAAIWPSDESGEMTPFVIDIADLTPRALGSDGYRYGFTRFDPDATALVAARGLTDGEFETLVEFDLAPSSRIEHREVSVSGAIEAVEHVGGRTWLVRVADTGSERDGMHLGTRVFGFGDPFVDPASRRWRRLTIVNFETGSTRAVPTDGWTIWEATHRDGAIVAIGSREPSPSGYYSPCVLRIDLETGELGVIGCSIAQLARPLLSSDSRHAHVIAGRSIVAGQLVRFDLDTGEDRTMWDLDDVTDFGYLDDARMWFSGWAGTGSFIEVRNVADGAVMRRLDLSGTIHGRDAQPSVAPIRAGAEFAIVLEQPGSPPEIHITTPTGSRPITNINTAQATAIRSRFSTTPLSWRASDGTVIAGSLLLPPEQRTGPPPLIVVIHGGPTWLWSAQFTPAESNQLPAVLAASGASVLLPNPRGSSGRSQAFSDTIVGGIGVTDVDDLVSGIDQLVTDGLADPTRIAVVGTSYGGFMSAWLAATHDRIKCAVAISCVSDWHSFAWSSAIGPGFVRTYFGDIEPSSRSGREALAACSPVCHATSSAAPMLVLHGAEDRITPIGQAEELVGAWRANGVPIDAAIYPREGHEFVDPRHRRDVATRVLMFLRSHGILE